MLSSALTLKRQLAQLPQKIIFYASTVAYRQHFFKKVSFVRNNFTTFPDFVTVFGVKK